ncbi:monooxygenase family protein, partial [Bacillus altitudinis]|uniref:monooxygenase family protein n=1 Tax=Bacillus altitudinis TaxID=293387 RepID=UPI00119D4935
MKKNIPPPTYTTHNSHPILLFIIPIRINKPSPVHQSLPLFNPIPPIIKQLYTHQQQLPFLPTQNYFRLPTTTIIQYSKSTHHLLPYPNIHNHFPPSKPFN